MNNTRITGGVYLVINPTILKETLVAKLTAALQGGINVVQIWNKWNADTNKADIITTICQLCNPYNVPVLINADWKLLNQFPMLSGVHFDEIPDNYELIKRTIEREIIAGITCGNNINTAQWAIENKLSYISFCSIFPSASAGICEIVHPDIINKVRELSKMPIFIAGGITPENITSLKSTFPFDGVAVVSAVMKAENPATKVKEYKSVLTHNKYQHDYKNN